jgi:hypothetical protein
LVLTAVAERWRYSPPRNHTNIAPIIGFYRLFVYFYALLVENKKDSVEEHRIIYDVVSKITAAIRNGDVWIQKFGVS